MNYNEFNEETKTFMNKVMDIYSTIKDMNINQTVKKFRDTVDYQFTKFDKKVLSFFIAGFFVDGNLKTILEQYDNIKLQDLLSFINISEEQICKLEEEEYSNFYSKNIKLELTTIVKERMWGYKVNYITPELIVDCLKYVSLSGSDILNYFGKKYGIISLDFYELPLFKVLDNFLLDEKIISEQKGAKPSEQSNEKTLPAINFNDESIWMLLDDIKKKFIGQEETAEGLFYNIINNQQLAEMAELPDGQRSIIFLDGPTGTGKTAITREITQKLGIPFTSTSITNYSSTGYVGGDITDTLKELYKKSNDDLEKAERGIIVLDEFDKIAYSRSGGLEMKRAVQQQLLDFLGGGKYTIRVGESIFDRTEIEFDTSKLTFVCLAALTDLRQHKTENKQLIGFGQSSEQIVQKDYTISPQDLIGIGLERELVGRFNTYLHTNDYSREDLMKILKESTLSPLIGFRQWIESKGKKLEVADDVYNLIADQAYELNTGARSLQTVMNNIRTPFIKEVLRGTSETIHLDSETVAKVGGQTINRKVRA